MSFTVFEVASYMVAYKMVLRSRSSGYHMLHITALFYATASGRIVLNGDHYVLLSQLRAVADCSDTPQALPVVMPYDYKVVCP